MTTSIEVDDVRRRYGTGSDGFEAVRGVSFDVRRGELFALLGTNGAGKTSTMELVAGFTRPQAGGVRVLGHDPQRERPAVRPKLGIMLQEGGLPADLTVAETATMWAGTLSTPRPVTEALTLVDLAHRTNVRVRQLSGGERRRLDLALAVLGRPAVLLLDEPTTGLDPESRRNTWRMIRGLLADGTTVLLTTHYLHEAQELADRLAIMHQGTVVAAGTPAEIVARHPARVRFRLPDGAGLEALPPLTGLRPDSDDRNAITIRTDALQITLTELLLWARDRGVELTGLEARPASLEEAFLAVAEVSA
jgi:ABC-2 type transport system ATP-binding protein